MENFKFLFQLYFKPAAAMSEIMDSGSWVFGAIATVILSIGLGFAVNGKIVGSYAVSKADYYYSLGGIDQDFVGSEGDASLLAENDSRTIAQRRPFPILGNAIFWLFSFDSSFITPLFVLGLFYFPGSILSAAIVGRLGNPGTVIKRDYATFTTCGLMAWAAAHLPFVLIALALSSSGMGGSIYLALWLASGLYFGALMVFALRTVFGLEYGTAGAAVGVSWIFYSIGIIAMQFISPWLFSPFLIIMAVLFFGGYIRGELSGIGNSMKQKRDFKRFLHNATVNPNDADAHVQLGLIYLNRRQDQKAEEHFRRAYEIDNEEIDANYELGRFARKNGDLQKAVEHFSVVVGENDRYALSEIWREIGITYQTAGMQKEAEEALEKFVKRRPFDSEGLYYYGMLLQEKGDIEEAKAMFAQAVEAVKTAPYYRKKELSQWARLAGKELV